MALLQKIVATGIGQPPESPFYYPDKIKQIFHKVKLQMNWCWTGESKPPERNCNFA